MVPTTPHMPKKTTKPAKMVRKGGPPAETLAFELSDPSEGFVFANTGLGLFFICSLTSF